MCDCQHGTVSKLLTNRLLYQLIRFHINRCCSLVQDQDLRLTKQRPRQTHQLSLTHAKTDTGQLSLLASVRWEMSSSLRATGEGLMWLIGTVVCLVADNRGSNCSLKRAMDGRILLCGIISS